jgi:hypothetical protein
MCIHTHTHNDSTETQIHYQIQHVLACVCMCVCVGTSAWVGLDLEAHQHQWLHQPKRCLSYESCDVILLPQQTSHLDIITVLLSVLHTSECMYHHSLLFIHFHPNNGRVNQ